MPRKSKKNSKNSQIDLISVFSGNFDFGAYFRDNFHVFSWLFAFFGIAALLSSFTQYPLRETAKDSPVLSSFINIVFAQQAPPADGDDGSVADDSFNYRHVRFLINTTGYGGEDSTADYTDASSEPILVTFQGSLSQKIVYVVNDHNGKFWFTCTQPNQGWLLSGCDSVSGLKLRGPRTPNPTPSVNFTISLNSSQLPTNCPAPSGCEATFTINGQTNNASKFKWDCPQPRGACSPDSIAHQSSSRTVRVRYISANAVTPLTCSGPSSSPGGSNVPVTFTATGGDPSDYRWSTSDPYANPTTQNGANPSFTTRFTSSGAQTVTVRSGQSVCNVPITIGSAEQRYKCSGTSCVADSSGTFTTSNCNNSCGAGGVPFSLTLTPSTQTLPNPNAGTSFVATVTSLNGFSGRVTLNKQVPASEFTQYDYPPNSGSGTGFQSNTDLLLSRVITPDEQTVTLTPGGSQSVTFTVTTQAGPSGNASLASRSDYIFGAHAYNPDSTVSFPLTNKYATSKIHVTSVCESDPAACGPSIVRCQPSTKTLAVNEVGNWLTLGGGAGPFLWSAPGGNPSSKTGIHPDGQFSTKYAAAGSYQVTVHEGSNAPVNTCFVTVVDNTPPPPGPFSCQLLGATPSASNPAYGVLNVTINNPPSGTSCTFTCTPGSPGCPTVYSGSGVNGTGGQGYGPITQQTTVTLKCQQGSAAPVNCAGSATIGGTTPPPPSCPAGQTNPHSVCQGSSCASVAGCGVSSCSNNTSCAPTATLSCSATHQPINNQSGYINFTVQNSTLATRCSFACTPGSANCPPATYSPGVGSSVPGQVSYGPLSQSTDISMSCKEGAAGTPVACSGTPITAGASSVPTCTITTITPNPLTAGSGAKAIVSWTSTNATQCQATAGPWFGSNLPPSGSLQSNEIATVPPGGATTFGMKCSNSAGTLSSQCTKVLAVQTATPGATIANLAVSCVKP